jgi:hypothetical protein
MSTRAVVLIVVGGILAVLLGYGVVAWFVAG